MYVIRSNVITEDFNISLTKNSIRVVTLSVLCLHSRVCNGVFVMFVSACASYSYRDLSIHSQE